MLSTGSLCVKSMGVVPRLKLALARSFSEPYGLSAPDSAVE